MHYIYINGWCDLSCMFTLLFWFFSCIFNCVNSAYGSGKVYTCFFSYPNIYSPITMTCSQTHTIVVLGYYVCNGNWWIFFAVHAPWWRLACRYETAGILTCSDGLTFPQKNLHVFDVLYIYGVQNRVAMYWVIENIAWVSFHTHYVILRYCSVYGANLYV